MALDAQRLVATAPQEEQELINEGVPAEKVIVRRNGIERPEKLPDRASSDRNGIFPKMSKLFYSWAVW
jgi:hypothetical protein